MAALRVTLQAVVPVQPPDQLAKVLPLAGVSVSVTAEPCAKGALQTFVVELPDELELVQLIPVGLLVTVPVPPPAVTTVS